MPHRLVATIDTAPAYTIDSSKPADTSLKTLTSSLEKQPWIVNIYNKNESADMASCSVCTTGPFYTYSDIATALNQEYAGQNIQGLILPLKDKPNHYYVGVQPKGPIR